MLLELAIGDAYGAGFEYNTSEVIAQYNNLSQYIQHPKHIGTKPGMYTDDTQMSLAIAEMILSKEEWTAQNITQKFVDCFKRDPREGYAHRFQEFLKEVKDGDEFLRKIKPDSDKSGAAMRASPIGIYSNIDDIIEKSTIQAKITHNTTDGINAAIAASLMSHYCLYDLGSVAEIGSFIEKYVPGRWSDKWNGKVGAQGWMSVKAAITAVTRNRKMSDLLKDCINFSGDVDTVATIALGAASCSDQYEQDLPDNLFNDLESEDYGRMYLNELDLCLIQLKGRI
ncbi:ADP-ribosylglycohydrolase family protein [Candidatus Woesearchaeota archaeon]|nr:ADP-ribosylglycohydrolase family protein [Candidatus Woesearchaeota archaeon]